LAEVGKRSVITNNRNGSVKPFVFCGSKVVVQMLIMHILCLRGSAILQTLFLNWESYRGRDWSSWRLL